MSRKNEDSIEKFFRKAVRQSDTMFRESDWLSMEKMLDEQAHARAAVRRRSIRRVTGVVTGLVILAVSLYLFIPADSPRSTIQGPQSTPDSVGMKQVRGPQPTADNSQQTTTDDSQQSSISPAQSKADSSRLYTTSSPQSAVRSPQLKAESSPRATVQSPQSKADNTQSSGKARQMDTQVLQHDNHGAQTSGDRSAVTTATQKNIEMTDVQRSVVQNAPVTEKQLRPKRSESPAISGHVTAANTSEHPDRTSQPLEIDSQTTTTTNSFIDIVTPTSTSGAQRTSVITGEHDGSAKDQRTPPVSTTTAAIPDRQVEFSSKTDQPVETDQTATPTPLTTYDSTSAPGSATASPLTTDKKPRTADRGLWTDSTSTIPLAETAPKDSSSQEPPKAPIRSRWNIALVIAPDFSSTGVGGEMSKPGQAFGGTIGYRLSRKFTVTGGVLKTSKKYVGYGNDYEPPEGYWLKRTNGVVPDEIIGRCTIIEVPITVQYELRQGARSRLYVSGGVSSYFMRHESYDYNFEEPNDGADRGWSSSAPESFLFKVGHLSVAYELMLMQRLGVGIEPFIKIPFQGIGWANISLYSTGAYVNVRYYLLRKNLK